MIFYDYIKFTVLCVLMASGEGFAQQSDSPVDESTIPLFQPYMSLKLATYVEQKSNRIAPAGSKDTEYALTLQDNSNFGVILSKGTVRGQVELGLDPLPRVYLRKAWISYKNGNFEFLFGQAYTPYTYFSSQASYNDNGAQGYGATYPGKKPYLMAAYAGAYMCLEGPSRRFDSTWSDDSPTIPEKYMDAVSPKVSAGYDFRLGNCEAGFGVSFNRFVIDAGDGSNADANKFDGQEVRSWVAYFHGKAGFGNMYLKLNFGFEVNPGNFGLIHSEAYRTTPDSYYVGTNSAGDRLRDTIAMEGFLEFGVKLTDVFTFDTGFAYTQARNRSPGLNSTDRMYAVWADVVIAADPCLKIVPCGAFRDFMEDAAGKREGYEYFIGIKFQGDLGNQSRQ